MIVGRMLKMNGKRIHYLIYLIKYLKYLTKILRMKLKLLKKDKRKKEQKKMIIISMMRIEKLFEKAFDIKVLVVGISSSEWEKRRNKYISGCFSICNWFSL